MISQYMILSIGKRPCVVIERHVTLIESRQDVEPWERPIGDTLICVIYLQKIEMNK